MRKAAAAIAAVAVVVLAVLLIRGSGGGTTGGPGTEPEPEHGSQAEQEQEQPQPGEGAGSEEEAPDGREQDLAGESAAAIVGRLTPEEKLGQLFFVGISGRTVTDETLELIRTRKVGGIILYADNMRNPEQSVELLNALKEANAGNPLPLFLGVDQEGGRVARLPGSIEPIPSSLEIGASGDPDYAYEIGRLLGMSVGAFGFNLDFAPVLDVNSNPDNPVIGDRSFGAQPETVAAFGVRAMEGIRSQHIVPVVKHFPGHGDTAVDSHLDLPVVDKSVDELRQVELAPFRQAIASGADMVMIAHILLPRLDADFPSSMSAPVVTGLLREELGYDGVVITDDMTMKAITNDYGIGEAAVRSFRAGCDLLLVAHNGRQITAAIEALREAVDSGAIEAERVDESLRRIVELKQAYALSDEKTEPPDIDALNEAIRERLR